MSSKGARLLAALAALTWPALAAGDDAATAISIFERAKALEKQGKLNESCDLMTEAHKLAPKAMGILLNFADCKKSQGKTATAFGAYKEAEFTCKREQDMARATYAHDEAAKLEPVLSMLTVRAQVVPGLIVRRDDEDVGKALLGQPLPVDPGMHKIEATAPGYQVWSTSVRIGERDHQTVEIPTLQRSSDDGGGQPGGSSAGAQRVAGFVVGGLGAASLAVGAIFGGVTLQKASASKSNGHCDEVRPDREASLGKAA
jgi:hypothetical protein